MVYNPNFGKYVIVSSRYEELHHQTLNSINRLHVNTELNLLLKHHLSQPLNLPPLSGSPPCGSEQSFPGLKVLELYGLFCGLDFQSAFLVHGDMLPYFDICAFRDKESCDTGVACLEREVEKWLNRYVSNGRQVERNITDLPANGTPLCPGDVFDLIPLSLCNQCSKSSSG